MAVKVDSDKCTGCDKDVKRIIGTGIGVIFKGSGFYATDYKNSSSSDGASQLGCNRDKTCCGKEERCDRPPCFMTECVKGNE